eukprot:SM000087S23340  [mRNA]  locus=s87:57769:65369:- [translate_table: standard]
MTKPQEAQYPQVRVARSWKRCRQTRPGSSNKSTARARVDGMSEGALKRHGEPHPEDLGQGAGRVEAGQPLWQTRPPLHGLPGKPLEEIQPAAATSPVDVYGKGCELIAWGVICVLPLLAPGRQSDRMPSGHRRLGGIGESAVTTSAMIRGLPPGGMATRSARRLTIGAAHGGHHRRVLHGHLVARLDEDTLHAIPEKVMGPVLSPPWAHRSMVGMAGTALALHDSDEAGGEEAQKPVYRRLQAFAVAHWRGAALLVRAAVVVEMRSLQPWRALADKQHRGRRRSCKAWPGIMARLTSREKRAPGAVELAGRRSLRALLRTANAVLDPLAASSAACCFSCNGPSLHHAGAALESDTVTALLNLLPVGSGAVGVDVRLQYATGQDLPQSVQACLLGLLESNMQRYHGAAWLAEAKLKQAQLVEDGAKYILITPVVKAISASGMTAPGVHNNSHDSSRSPPADDPTEPQGFVQFRFVEEEGVPVLYVYELQLGHPLQRCGLGTLLMRLMERVAQESSMAGIMLTVQTKNTGALDFYLRKLNYEISPISPNRVTSEDSNSKYDYVILQKISDANAKEALKFLVSLLERILTVCRVLKFLRAGSPRTQLENYVFPHPKAPGIAHVPPKTDGNKASSILCVVNNEVDNLSVRTAAMRVGRMDEGTALIAAI